jgi:aspartyl-tRNA(Asn)/glutamyl-tRNA(Gln) amidotransferase subunit A
MSGELADMSLTAVATLIRRGRASALEVTDACLRQIEAWQPQVNAFLEVEGEAARKAARSRDRELRRGEVRGPLHGVPLAHKDVFYHKGRICSAGSKIRAGWVAGYTATVIDRLENAGAICLGRLGMAEFAADPTGHNAHYGACRNPWNTAYIPGASSSGAGAAVAARLVCGALGSDTGGSIRLPAAACGVVGLMPTQGRVSHTARFPAPGASTGSARWRVPSRTARCCCKPSPATIRAMA